jgi:adenylate cyclase
MADKQTVLVVDDTPENIDVLVGVLSSKYRVKVAQNGEKALKVVAKAHPDLILLDVMMPVMDGFETCERLKADPETDDIPIIFLTAKATPEDIVKGFDLGAVDYVTKPFNARELEVRVSNHLQLKNARSHLEHKNTQLETLANKLSKYLSPQVYDSIFTGEKDVKIETSRKPLTILFSDIVGFTAKSESMEHGELTAWLNNYLDEMAKLILEYEGTLDKFIGDGIMVFFGDPKTEGEQNDAIRCIKLAKAMQKKAAELGVEVRIGVNSGSCTVGNFGSQQRMEYTIIGKSVNLAARLEHAGAPNKILISENAQELIKDDFSTVPNKLIRVKGIDRDIQSFWLE